MGTATAKDREKGKEPRDAYDDVYLGLIQLKGLIVSMGLIVGEADDEYITDNVGGALGLVEEWIDGILEDMDDVQPAKVDLLTQCKKAKEAVATGVLGLHGNLHSIKGVIAEVDRFLNEDLGQIMKIRQELEETAEGISRELLGKRKNEASAEPRIQTEAQGDPEGSNSKTSVAEDRERIKS